ncbi:MAG: hypothetical protein KGL39_23835 [Patescibacteria group bacterium]|nr:hypothetical protein [Patescibacteria group bacterium]
MPPPLWLAGIKRQIDGVPNGTIERITVGGLRDLVEEIDRLQTQVEIAMTALKKIEALSLKSSN